MFTGVIQHTGTIQAAQKHGDLRLTVACDYKPDAIKIGESIAVNGACLTVIDTKDGLTFDLSAETLACTAPRWNKGARVNLERALKLGDRLDGHMVTGHVDGLAKLLEITPSSDSNILCLEAPEVLARFIAEKGSVTLDGVSLTVNQVEGRRFWVNIIPHTWRATTLGERKPGDALNLEIDLIARYLDRLLTK
jgi:riboflavin synthase